MLKKTLFLMYCFVMSVTVQAEPISEAEQEDYSGLISYRPSTLDLSIRRVEAGVVEGSYNRGLSRGLSRGLNRGLIRGLAGETEVKADETAQGRLPDRLVVLAPQHTGFTINPQPTLYWYVSGASSYPIQFNVNQAGLLDPIIEVSLPAPQAEGIYTIKLADYDVYLKLDVEHEWFLTIILDNGERSSDFTTGATLRYRAPSAEELTWQTDLPKAQQPQHYASAGLWYDAFDSLSQLIEQDPQQTLLKKTRSALLKQVELPRAAAFASNN